MNGRRMKRLAWLLVWGLAIAASAPATLADDDGRRLTRVPPLPTYQQECSACHMAYPPALLPAASWNRLLHNLPRHFGTDASLDTKTVAQLAAWLTSHAATGRHSSTPPRDDRITQSAWFLHEHDEIPPAIWRRKAIGSPSNCMACHTQADQGHFNEHDIRIPR